MSELEALKVQSINIDFQNVECSFRQYHKFPFEKKRILHGVNGSFKSGELTAVMGPSGSGKTTLLNILTGFQRNFEGKVTYRGESGELNYELIRKYSRFIQQEDALHDFFSVQETVNFASELKLDRRLSQKTRQKITDELLNSLDLIKTKDTLCGNLSGGQRKRLSIALELINNPLAIFLDEPTTGLDIVAAMQCVKVLKNLAENNRTIVCTIHQPSSAIFELFDHVYLVADGRSVYQGDPNKMVNFFSSVGLTCPVYHNPADFAIEVISKDYGDFNKRLEAAQDFSWRKTHVNTVEEGRGRSYSTTNPPSELQKAAIIFKRCALRYYKDWFTTLCKIIIFTITPVFVGLTYFDVGMNAQKVPMNLSMMVFSTLVLFYCSIIPSVLKFHSEISILRKEHLNDWYKIRTYFVCYIGIHLLVQFIFITLFISILYILTSNPLEWKRFVMFELMVLLTCYIGEGIGLNLGIIAQPLAGTFGAITTGMLNIPFCGYFILKPHMSPFMYKVSHIMFAGYTMDGLIQAIYGFDREKIDCPVEESICYYKYPKILMLTLGINEEHYTLDTIVLSVHFIFLFILAYFSLKRKVSSI